MPRRIRSSSAFSIALSLLTAVLFGLAPAWQSVRPEVLPELKDVSAAAIGGRDRTLLRKSLIAFQIALSLVILFAAGLLTRTLSRLQTIDLGFKPSHVIALSVDPAMNGYSPADTNRVFDEILSRLRAQPGITAASLATISPLEGMFIRLDLEVPGHMDNKSDVSPGFDMVSPGYFRDPRSSRCCSGAISPTTTSKMRRRVAIVNEFFVSQYMPGQNPIGRRFKSGGGDVEIVGVRQNGALSEHSRNSPAHRLSSRQTDASLRLHAARRRPRRIRALRSRTSNTPFMASTPSYPSTTSALCRRKSIRESRPNARWASSRLSLAVWQLYCAASACMESALIRSRAGPAKSVSALPSALKGRMSPGCLSARPS